MKELEVQLTFKLTNSAAIAIGLDIDGLFSTRNGVAYILVLYENTANCGSCESCLRKNRVFKEADVLHRYI